MAKITFDYSKIDTSDYLFPKMSNPDSDIKIGVFSILVVAFVGIFLCVKCCMALDGTDTSTTNNYSTTYTPSTVQSNSYTTAYSSTSSSPYLEIGKSYKIVSNTIVGSTKNNLKEIYSYALNGNSEGMIAMALLGQGTILSCATVSIADYDGRTVKLRIINDGVTGEANGYYCYAFQSDIRKNTTKL